MNALLVSPGRQRLPFLFPLASAILGIVAAEMTPMDSSIWLGVSLVAGVWYFAMRSRVAFLIFCASVFALLHLWQSRESPAAILAARIGQESPHGEATGIVTGEVRTFSGKSSFTLAVDHLRMDEKNLNAPLALGVESDAPPPAPGDSIRVTGILQNLSPPRNPGQFDSMAWSERRGIFSRLRVAHANDTQILATSQGNPIESAALKARDWMQQTLTRGLDDPLVANLLIGMTLGDTTAMPEGLRESFRGTGTFHLFAVSGLHVGILAVLFWSIFTSVRIPRRAAAALIIPILCFYALMTGLKPANTRATVMAVIILIGLMGRRQPLLFNNLLAAAFLILLTNTNQLFNPGFQFSFSVVAAIMIFEPGLRHMLAAPFIKDPFLPESLLSPGHRFGLKAGQYIAALVAVSTAAWIGSLPLTLGYFHLISLSAIPANLLAVPLAFAIMAVGLLSLGAAGISITLSVIFNQTNWLLSRILIGGISTLAAFPASFIYVKTPDFPKPIAEVVVFDFGSGGAVWLSVRGRSWLFDTGSLYHHDTVLLPFLHSQGVRSLDGLLISHGDAGHIGASSSAVASFTPHRIIESMLKDHSSHRHRLHADLQRLGIPKSLHRSGDAHALAPGATLHILHPPPGLSLRTADEKILVVRADIEEVRILFMFDSGLAVERWLLANSPGELACDILVRGAPSSGPAANSAFLDAAHPQVVIATAATFPRSEQISPALIEILNSAGIPLFRQDECGAVTIRILSPAWEVSAFLTDQHFSHLR